MESRAQPAQHGSLEGTLGYRNALSMVKKQLASKEEILWCAEPNRQIMLRHLIYRAGLQWFLFTCILPMTPEIIILTIVFMAYLAFIEYRRNSLGIVYAITDQRVLLGKMRPNMTLALKEYKLATLKSVKKTPITRTAKLKFRDGFKTGSLDLAYLPDPEEAVTLLDQRRLSVRS